ncbi:MAG: M81 family metallopeptidase [Pseudomonadota bacterium]
MFKRIAIAGFQHESNSFAPNPATLADFERADSWPGMLRGPEVTRGTRGLNLPIAGFIEAAEAELVPILWCAAEPSGPVTTQAFDAIAAEIMNGVQKSRADAIYLDLHGAMITEDHLDGEGELVRRIREVAPETPIAISLDLHANLSPDLVALADVITIYRTYPHLDMAETGARAWRRLLNDVHKAASFLRADYILPLHCQWTGAEPTASLYRMAEELDAELALGFSAGDTPYTSVSLVAYHDDPFQAERNAQDLLNAVQRAESRFNPNLPSAAAAVAQAMALQPGKPVILADVEDNAGGGGSADTVGLLRAMVEAGVEGALLGVLCDPAAALQAHAKGVGARFETSLGGRSGLPGEAPFETRVEVAALSDGRVAYEGEMYGGGLAEIGPTALLRIAQPGLELRVVVSSERTQCLDRAFFRHLGAEPEEAAIIGVKSTVHYRADFDPIAQATIPCRAPGLLSSRPQDVQYHNLRPGVRLGPNGPLF